MALAGFYRDTLHGREARLASIGAEVSRVRECAGAPHSAAMALVRRHVYDLEGLSAGAVAVAALWLAARGPGEPRPLGDFLKCSKADKSAVKRAAWRLNEAARGRRPPIEEYVKMVAARANLPASAVRRALEILEGNRRVAAGRSPWVLAAALWLATYKEYGMLMRLARRRRCRRRAATSWQAACRRSRGISSRSSCCRPAPPPATRRTAETSRRRRRAWRRA